MNFRTLIFESSQVQIPAWVVDLVSFRQWFHSDDFPETGRICFLAGEIWIDMSKEQFFSHNQVKAEYNNVLGPLGKLEKLGRFVPYGMLLTNVEADLSCQPDGTFITHESFRTGKVRLVEGKEEGFVELEGSPDMVLEVISSSSVDKDTVLLRELYWKAGVAEYWIVDARGETWSFEILRYTNKKYVSVRPQKGWLKSAVFEKSFRLVRTTDSNGDPEITLEVQ